MKSTFETAVVSYIEPEPGYAREFNHWYETDHFPSAVMAGPGVVRGERFVATRACKALRPPEGRLFGDPARGSYLAYALIAPGRQAEWDAWVVDEMKVLTEQGRLFPHREHVHTAVYHHRMSTGTAEGLDADPANAIVVARSGGHDSLGRVRGWSMLFTLERTIVSSAQPPPHTLLIARVPGDPIEAFGELELPEAVGFASPFLATVPGTDAYTEEL